MKMFYNYIMLWSSFTAESTLDFYVLFSKENNHNHNHNNSNVVLGASSKLDALTKTKKLTINYKK